MAVVSLTTGYNHADGIRQRYGAYESTVSRVGEYSRLADGRHCVEATINLLTLSTAAPAAGGNECIIADNVTIPTGAFIEEIHVMVTKETAGSNANLDLGLVDQDRTTEIDFNGLLAAADAFNGGTDLGTWTQYIVGTTEVGALVGTLLTNTGYLTASPDTADWTAGVIKVRIYYSTPLTADV